MQNFSHGALIHFSADVVGGAKTAHQILESLHGSKIQFVGISSVYKRFKDRKHADLNATMEFVVKVITSLGPEELLLLLSQHEDRVHPRLLAYDDLILMAPQLTLPYPKLHHDSLIIHCAAEAWGQYEHPVYQKIPERNIEGCSSFRRYGVSSCKVDLSLIFKRYRKDGERHEIFY